MHRAIVLELKSLRIAVHLGKVFLAQGDPTRTGKTVYKRLGRDCFSPSKGKTAQTKKNVLRKLIISKFDSDALPRQEPSPRIRIFAYTGKVYL